MCTCVYSSVCCVYVYVLCVFVCMHVLHMCVCTCVYFILSWQVKSLVVVDLDTDEIQYKNFPAGSQYGMHHVPRVPQQAVEEFKERYTRMRCFQLYHINYINDMLGNVPGYTACSIH